MGRKRWLGHEVRSTLAPLGEVREAKRVSDEVRSTCAQAQLAECLVFQRVVGGVWMLGSGGGGGVGCMRVEGLAVLELGVWRLGVIASECVCVCMCKDDWCVGWLSFRG